jgi:hypothetical protein
MVLDRSCGLSFVSEPPCYGDEVRAVLTLGAVFMTVDANRTTPTAAVMKALASKSSLRHEMTAPTRIAPV